MSAQQPELVQMPLHDKDIELALLKKLLSPYEEKDSVMRVLETDYFYHYDHQLLFKAIRQVYDRGEAMEMISVSNQLMQTLGDESRMRLMMLVATIGTQRVDDMSLGQMVAIVRDYGRKRRLMPIAWELKQLSDSPSGSLAEGVAHAIEKLNQVVEETQMSDFSTLADQLQVAVQHIEDNERPETAHMGILTSIPLFDECGGLPPGLVVVAGKSSHGKTSFANFLALNAMKSGSQVAYYSLEMTNLQLAQRLLAMESGISANLLAHHKLFDWQKRVALDGAERLIASHAESFRFDDRSINRLDRMLQSIRALKRSRGVDLVVVDYIQLLGIDSESRDESTAKRIGHAAHAMHNIGIELGVTIVCLSQLNRNAQGIPTRAQIRDSGEIDEAADMTILIYRAQADKLECYPAPFESLAVKDTALVLLDKSRNGATGHAVLGFEPSTTAFKVLQDAPQAETKWVQKEIEYWDSPTGPH